MSGKKARTTIADSWTWIQQHRSDIILGLLVLNTVLLLISFLIHATSHDVRSMLRQEQVRELGGETNYDRYQEIISSDPYRQQQTFLINQKYKSFFPDSYTYDDADILSGSEE